MMFIKEARNFYARFIVNSARAKNDNLIAAFANVERENFVGRGPWRIFVGSGYIDSISDDPSLLYQDLLVALDEKRGINNGQPSLHAICMDKCNPKQGESVVHIGTGTGYYSAILSELVGQSGNITAYEIEPKLFESAAENLAHLTNVEVLNESASDTILPKSDVIYVSASATHPMPTWLDALKIGGRLIFPLSPDNGMGFMLLVTLIDKDVYSAVPICNASFIPCIGARSVEMSKNLKLAMETKKVNSIRSLFRNNKPDDSAWCIGSDWWLSKKDPAAK